MKVFKIVSATPETHYKNQKGFNVVLEYPGYENSQSKTWFPEAQYNLALFMQENKVLDNLSKKQAEQFLSLIEEFGQSKYCEGSIDEAMSNSEDL